MTDTTDPEYRSYTSPESEDIEVRQPEDEDGVFDVRMPIATTGEVRNQGDEPLTRDELEGMARQIEERNIGVFLDHGGTDLGGMERYSAIEKIGEWRDAGVNTREADDESELVATARLMDPETLPNGVSSIREAIGAIKEQVQRGFSVSASIGWREDDAYPGGNDLMEASIVGIGADPRTTSDADAATVARAAVDAGADPEDLIAEVRAAVREDTDESRPFGPPGGDEDQWDTFDECVNEVEDWDNIDDPEAFCAWAEEQTKDADTDNHDMSDTDDTPEEGDTTEEQQSEEPDEEQAPEDIGEDDIAEFVAEIYDGVDSADFIEAMNEAGGEFGGLDEDTVSWFVGDVLDLTAGEVMDMLDEGEDNEMDEDEDEEDDEEQASDEPDEEQDAKQSDLEERIASLEDELAEFRSGEGEVETPEPDEEQDADNEQTREANDNDDKYGIY